jgi:hypothetical protein
MHTELSLGLTATSRTSRVVTMLERAWSSWRRSATPIQNVRSIRLQWSYALTQGSSIVERYLVLSSVQLYVRFVAVHWLQVSASTFLTES